MQEKLWAIAESPQGDLVCWRGSQGVPFMSPCKQLVERTMRDADECITPAVVGKCRAVVEVLVYCDPATRITLILTPHTHDVLCVLKPSNRS